jgi:hypothetical protein
MHTLLHDAAPKPVRPLDMVAVRERARRRSLRRIVAWLAGVSAVIGVGVPLGSGVLVNAGKGERVGVIGPDRSVKDNATVDGRVEAEVPSAGIGVSASASFDAPTPTTQTMPQSRAPTTTTTPSVDYPSAASCSVDNQNLADGQSRSCRFSATAAGGWRSVQLNMGGAGWDFPTARVRVIRAGKANTYFTDSTGQGCGNDVIQPGDQVEVTITQSTEVVHTLIRVGAGERWSCSESG